MRQDRLRALSLIKINLCFHNKLRQLPASGGRKQAGHLRQVQLVERHPDVRLGAHEVLGPSNSNAHRQRLRTKPSAATRGHPLHRLRLRRGLASTTLILLAPWTDDVVPIQQLVLHC
eukprot:4841282-Pyramimonas_sp.AAC.1